MLSSQARTLDYNWEPSTFTVNHPKFIASNHTEGSISALKVKLFVYGPVFKISERTASWQPANAPASLHHSTQLLVHILPS